ncbi:MAG TPA: helix-turn-helix domain-containing protein [Methanocella sp.]|uniref:winged helix-turn-helix transcriptional regulator n=1 Tax=Methanocella sp. TaxID=2052833 RepID=UPI002C5EDDE6|nr:helix-turn-helix domain-containing protein [Methanocella sp.]HTY91548.1 helix-turn-helix domain-containing protein [Methanocella sp.]
MINNRKTCTYHCEVDAAFAIMGGRWKAQIIWHISDGNPRFKELRNMLKTVSQRMLSKQLKELEDDGLVTRTVYTEVPIRVEYQLTEAGRALLPIMKELGTWVKEKCPEIVKRIEQ